MKKNPEVDRWFADKKPKSQLAIQRVRETILGGPARGPGRCKISRGAGAE